MKKLIKIVASIAMVFAILFTFASCTKTLNGTYESSSSVVSSLNGSLTFDRDNNVTGQLTLPIIGDVSVDGEYSIEDGKITFTYNLLGIEKDLTYTFEKDGSSIIIDGSEFEKQ